MYPDRVYTAVITAYTYNGVIRGSVSPPLVIRTLVSTPIVSSLTAFVSVTGIVIEWELYSSGLADADVDLYQIELLTEGVQMVYQTQHRSYVIDEFESHSIYSINLFGIRNGSNGLSLQTEVYTEGYGLPPTPLLLQTKERELENKTDIIIAIKQVSVSYTDFSIHISCKQSNSTRQISLFESISDFRGGNLTLTLNRTQKLNSIYNCTAALSNIFGNNSLIFTYAGPKSTTTTTTTIIMTTGTIIILGTTTTHAPEPYTPFLITLIVVMVFLLLISICISLVIVVIVYMCVRGSVYEVIHSGNSDKEKDRLEFSEPGDGFEYEAIRVIKKYSNREEIEVTDTTCETTSV